MKIIEAYLTPNKYSRPQRKINQIKGIVVHWVANPNTTAKFNRDFFENRKDGNHGYGSAHYLIDLYGSIIIDIPENEMANHVGADSYSELALKNLSSYPNDCTISIECTHIDWNGTMNPETYNALIELSADLIKRYSLDAINDLYRHFDITGKDCPRWFVINPERWMIFKNIVHERVQELKKTESDLYFDP